MTPSGQISNKRTRSLASVLSGTALTLTAIFLSLAVPRSLQAAEGSELLARIGVTSVERNYSGRKVVIDFSSLTPQVSKLTVIHQLDGKERRVYQASKSVVVIDGDYFYQYYPDKALLLKKKLPGKGGYEALQRESLEQTLVSYDLRNYPSEAIAGRNTRRYEFVPRDKGTRPTRKVWVDVETGLFLRMEIYSSDDRLFWLSAFEDIDYQPRVTPANFDLIVPPEVRVVETKEGNCLEPEAAAEEAGFPIGIPRYLPEGFVRKCVRVRRGPSGGEIQVLYSDGLSLLSLFQSSKFRTLKGGGSQSVSLDVGGRPGNIRPMGLINALSWQPAWAHLTILGEISQAEMLKVAESVQPLRELSRP